MTHISVGIRRKRKGFTLFELIAVLVLSGLIGGFSTLFLSTGVKSFIFAKTNAETSLKTAIALQRIDLEWRNMESMASAQTTATQIEYTSDLYRNTRRLTYDVATQRLVLSVWDGSGSLLIDQAPLLDNVIAFTVTVNRQDLDRTSNTPEEVLWISYSIDLSVNGSSLNFSKQIRPRSIFR